MIFHNSFEFSKSQHGRNQQRIVDQGCRGLWTSRQHSHLSGHCVSMIKIHLFSRFKLVNLSDFVLCLFIEYGSIFYFIFLKFKPHKILLSLWSSSSLCKWFQKKLLCFVFNVEHHLLGMVFFSRAVIGVGVEDEDKKHTWMEDAESVSILIIYSVKSTVTCMTKRALILKICLYLVYLIQCLRFCVAHMFFVLSFLA